MTKLHESHTKDSFTHDCFRTQTDQELDLCEPWTNMDKWLWKCYHISKIFHRSNDKWDPDSPKGSQAFCGVCVCSLEIHFSYLWSHTQTHRHTNIFPHGKVSRIVSSGQQRISQLIQHHTKSLSSLLASPNKLSGETSKQNKAPWVQQLVRPAPNQTIRSTAQSEGL